MVTRPDSTAAGTAQRLREMGHEVVFAPCLKISPRPAELPDRPAALVLTSSQAVAALPARYRALPAFCVGDLTAMRLARTGFTNVMSAGGDAEDLLRLVAARRVPGLHLLPVGAHQGFELAERLTAAGIQVLRVVVYAASAADALPLAALAALTEQTIDAALFYSAESALAFNRLAPPNTGRVLACALSAKVAVAVGGLPWRAIRVAVAPNETDLLALLNE
jgi:uroporphyrinogen-III synthase